MKTYTLSALSYLAFAFCLAKATPTENYDFELPKAPEGYVVNGTAKGWNLNHAVFACENVETMREQAAVWLSGMYDDDYFYILAQFIDSTPLNNPGTTTADYGFAGDSLQIRLLFGSIHDREQQQIAHITAWKGADQNDVIEIGYGLNANLNRIPDAKQKGAKQVFRRHDNGTGYVQEIAIPWALLTKDGKRPQSFRISFEPNFTVGKNTRMTVKDVFSRGVPVDRVFSFRAHQCWGMAKLLEKPSTHPRPVRLADAREFPVIAENDSLRIDWTGLIENREPKGFKTIRFSIPEDGYVSLNLYDKKGVVVRQLLTAAFYSKGEHEVKWDGLSTPVYRNPGDPLPEGDYQWKGIWRKEIGLKLRGFASNAGRVPWDDGPTSNWGGDQGSPTFCTTQKEVMLLGWSGAEAGKSVVATDLDGNVLWRNNRQGMAGARMAAIDGNVAYIMGGGHTAGRSDGGAIYKLSTKEGHYLTWGNGEVDLITKNLWEGAPEKAFGMAAYNGQLVISYPEQRLLVVLDGATGRVLRKVDTGEINPGFLSFSPQGECLALSNGNSVHKVDLETGKAQQLLGGLQNATAFGYDAKGHLYVATGTPDHQISIYSPSGSVVKRIGKKGGRQPTGPWEPEAFLNIGGLALDEKGQLWVSERGMTPRRISIWNPQQGTLHKELFGCTDYGALGASINPLDPNVMVGEGAEWRLDPQTGKSHCTGVFSTQHANAARFCAVDGRLFLATTIADRQADAQRINLYERLGEGNYKLRSTITHKRKEKVTEFWADENDDSEIQEAELETVPTPSTLGGYYLWSIYLSNDLTLTAEKSYKVTGYTACGAPKYDLVNASPNPEPGLLSQDGRHLIAPGQINSYTQNELKYFYKGYSYPDGKLLWTYPAPFSGVHGSHRASPPEPGLLRGTFGPIGTAKLPPPVGNIWAINSNVGEWHLLTEEGFYLTRLFQGDPLKVAFPKEATPGSDMSDAPPGLGGEDFGGSMTQGKDGKVYIQAGKTGLWNLEVTGLETIQPLKPVDPPLLHLAKEDVEKARKMREEQLQANVGKQFHTIVKLTPSFTGNLQNDFKDAPSVFIERGSTTRIRCTASWDQDHLYVGWEVTDTTPWVNGATIIDQMYTGGDTVDLQLGTDPDAPKDRETPVLGDLRVSIGNFAGEPRAVLYRKVAKTKSPKTYSSGVVKEYVMESVTELTSAKIAVQKATGRYVVEAQIPFTSLDFTPKPGLRIAGDFGVTFGDPSGQRTRLRHHWSNQHTGIVDDAVFELMMEPKYWGTLEFQ